MGTTTIKGSVLGLLHLCSANLPVGAFAYSQGLESAVELEWVTNSDELEEWIEMQLNHSIALVDLPILMRVRCAVSDSLISDLLKWNALALACRESDELRAGDLATGAALQRLLRTQRVPLLCEIKECSFVTAFGEAAAAWRIDPFSAMAGYAWTVVENQVMASTKLMPVGQSEAHRLICRLRAQIPDLVDRACSVPDDEIGSSLPALAVSSVRHETQYTRLFRS